MTRLIAFIAAVLLSATAFAGDDQSKTDTGTKTTATFESLDKNSDQQLSKTEAAADKKLSESFASMDTNGDGYLSKSEYMARSKT